MSSHHTTVADPSWPTIQIPTVPTITISDGTNETHTFSDDYEGDKPFYKGDTVVRAYVARLRGLADQLERTMS